MFNPPSFPSDICKKKGTSRFLQVYIMFLFLFLFAIDTYDIFAVIVLLLLRFFLTFWSAAHVTC